MDQMQQPNVLFILTDQQAWNAMSCAGNPSMRTPAIDGLARRGMRFTNAYCTQPLCVPSRASFITGRYPHEVGVPYNLREHECEQAHQFPWLGNILKAAGYQTAWVGKWHLPTPVADVDCHGFDITREARDNRLDWLVADHCREILAARRDQPLFLAASFVNPHDCCEAARMDPLPNGEIGDPPAAESCPELPGNFNPPDDEPAVLRNKVMPSQPRVYPSVAWDEARWRQYRWQYAQLVEKVDAQIGQVLAALDASGIADHTAIIFTSDHGDGVGSHRWNQKQVLYEEAARVPLIIAAPHGQAGCQNNQLVSMNLDLIPTVCDYAGCRPPEELTGRSLRGWVQGQHLGPWREAVFCETEFAGFGRGKTTGVRGRMVRTQRHKYIVYSEGEHREQLFDLETDPGEMIDLSGEEDHRSMLQGHRNLLKKWCSETNDDFVPI